MAIQVGGTQVISNSQGLTNITSIDSTTATAIGNAGVGGGGMEMLQDTAITSTIAYIDYTFPSGYDTFIFHLNGLRTSDTNGYAETHAQLKDTSNNLVTTNYWQMRAWTSSTATGRYRLDPLGNVGAANGSFSTNNIIHIYDPKTACPTVVTSQGGAKYTRNNYGQTYSYGTACYMGHESMDVHNGIRIYLMDGSTSEDIHSSSVGYQIWGIKNA